MAAILGAIALSAGPFAHRAKADAWDKLTRVTVHEPVQVSDTYLEPGTYVFRLADLNSERHIVQIFNSDQTHIINTVMAIPNYRLEPTGASRFAFYETPPGNVKAMRAWFYPGDNFGQEFRYPQHLRQVAYNTTPQMLTAPSQPAPAPQVSAAVALAPVPETSSVELTPAPSNDRVSNDRVSNDRVEIAQNTPRAAAAEPTLIAQNTPPPAAPPELPKTASPFTAFGLGGLTLLGLAGVVRFASSVA